jgi:hypothetical protein
MAADDEFPRGITVVINLTGNITITLPALVGLAWVLTGAKASGGSGYNGAYGINLLVNGVVVDSSYDYTTTATATTSVSFEGQWMFTQNTAVTIEAVNTGSLNLDLIVEAYPV